MGKDLYHLVVKYYDDWFAINRIYNSWAKNHGVSQKELFVIYEIANSKGTCTQRQICERFSYRKQTVSQIIHNLERENLVTLEVLACDKRNRNICFTDKGRAFSDELLLELKDREIKAFMTMSEEERQVIVDGFHLLSKALDNAFIK